MAVTRYGGDLPSADEATLALLTNPEVLAVNQWSSGNREVARDGTLVAWAADAPDGAVYLGLFNLGDAASPVPVDLASLGLRGTHAVRDLWARKDLAPASGRLAPAVAPHGSMILRVAR